MMSSNKDSARAGQRTYFSTSPLSLRIARRRAFTVDGPRFGRAISAEIAARETKTSGISPRPPDENVEQEHDRRAQVQGSPDDVLHVWNSVGSPRPRCKQPIVSLPPSVYLSTARYSIQPSGLRRPSVLRL